LRGIWLIWETERKHSTATASMDVEDWDLSAEDLDSLERDAFQKIAQLRNPPPPSSPHQHHNSSTATMNHFPSNPLPNSRPQTVKLLSFLIAVNLSVMGTSFFFFLVCQG